MLNSPPATPPSDQLTPEQIALLRKMAIKIAERRMTAPAILFLESFRPMNYIGSQLMLVLQPMLNIFFTLPEWDELRRILERRESIGLFMEMLDEEEGNFLLRLEQEKAERKKKHT